MSSPVDTALRFMAFRYSSLSMAFQSTTLPSFWRSIQFSQIRMARPFPSRKGWAIFISAYLSTTWSKLSWGSLSIYCKDCSKKIQNISKNSYFTPITQNTYVCFKLFPTRQDILQVRFLVLKLGKVIITVGWSHFYFHF